MPPPSHSASALKAHVSKPSLSTWTRAKTSPLLQPIRSSSHTLFPAQPTSEPTTKAASSTTHPSRHRTPSIERASNPRDQICINGFVVPDHLRNVITRDAFDREDRTASRPFQSPLEAELVERLSDTVEQLAARSLMHGNSVVIYEYHLADFADSASTSDGHSDLSSSIASIASTDTASTTRSVRSTKISPRQPLQSSLITTRTLFEAKSLQHSRTRSLIFNSMEQSRKISKDGGLLRQLSHRHQHNVEKEVERYALDGRERAIPPSQRPPGSESRVAGDEMVAEYEKAFQRWDKALTEKHKNEWWERRWEDGEVERKEKARLKSEADEKDFRVHQNRMDEFRKTRMKLERQLAHAINDQLAEMDKLKEAAEKSGAADPTTTMFVTFPPDLLEVEGMRSYIRSSKLVPRHQRNAMRDEQDAELKLEAWIDKTVLRQGVDKAQHIQLPRYLLCMPQIMRLVQESDKLTKEQKDAALEEYKRRQRAIQKGREEESGANASLTATSSNASATFPASSSASGLPVDTSAILPATKSALPPAEPESADIANHEAVWRQQDPWRTESIPSHRLPLKVPTTARLTPSKPILASTIPALPDLALLSLPKTPTPPRLTLAEARASPSTRSALAQRLHKEHLLNTLIFAMADSSNLQPGKRKDYLETPLAPEVLHLPGMMELIRESEEFTAWQKEGAEREFERWRVIVEEAAKKGREKGLVSQAVEAEVKEDAGFGEGDVTAT